MDKPRDLKFSVVACVMLAGVALLASVYLWYASAAGAAGPSGGLTFCPETESVSCEAVLASRYGRWLGIPVAAVGTANYLVLLAACVGLLAAGSVSSQRTFWSVAWVATALGTLAGFWLLIVQIFLLARYCVVCDLIHLCALVSLVLLTWMRPASLPGTFWPVGGTLAVLAGVALMAGQLLVAPEIRADVVLARPSTNGNAATQAAGTQPTATAPAVTQEAAGTQPGRTFVLADAAGTVLATLDMDEQLVMGDPDAERTLVEIIDYGCTECKQQTALFEEILKEHPHWFRLILLLYPGNKECNPHTQRERTYVCLFARAALAMHIHRPDLFPQLHHLLYRLQGTVTGGMAWQMVKQLAGIDDDTLSAWQQDPEVDARLSRHISISHTLNANVESERRGLPSLFANGRMIVGAADSKARLYEVITQLIGPPEGGPPTAPTTPSASPAPSPAEEP